MMSQMTSGIERRPHPSMERNGMPGEYNQYNPLQTNADGKYAWDVPEGWWRVKIRERGI